jgi:hypothetical protein
MKKSWSSLAALSVLALALIACPGGGTPNTPVLTSIQLIAPSTTLEVGGTVAFTAAPKDQNGNAMSGVSITFNSSDPSKATVTSGGVATGAAAGTTNITASSGGVTSNAVALTVTPQPTSFTISNPTPASLTLGASDLKTASVIVSRSGGQADPISFELLGVPTNAGLTANVSPNPASLAQSTVTVTLSTNDSPTNGTYPLTLRATGGNVQREVALSVTVNAPRTIFSEDFANDIPATWTAERGPSGATGAIWTTTTSLTPGAPFTGKFAVANSGAAGPKATDTALTTPKFDATGCTTLTLEFVNQLRLAAGNSAKGDVDVSTNNGLSWTNALQLRATDGYLTGVQKTVTLPALTANQPEVRVRWHYYDTINDWWWAIDSVRVRCN